MPGMGCRWQVKPAGGIRQKSRLQASLPGFSHRIPLAIGKTNRLHPRRQLERIYRRVTLPLG